MEQLAEVAYSAARPEFSPPALAMVISVSRLALRLLCVWGRQQLATSVRYALGSPLKGDGKKAAKQPSSQVSLTEQGKHALLSLVSLSQRGDTGLVEDRKLRQISDFLRDVGSSNTVLGSR